jgi:hypothetical protein
MNYEKIYHSLIQSRLQLNRKFSVGCGLEKHHIIPKSLGGSNNKNNIIVLTPREHCIAHILLSKMYSGVAKAKMCYALIALTKLRNKNRTAITSRQYENLKKAYNKALMNPDYRALRSENTKKQWTPERRAAVSQKTKLQWTEPNSKKRKSFGSTEYKTKKSQQMKQQWQNPEYIKLKSEQAKQQWIKQKFEYNQ